MNDGLGNSVLTHSPNPEAFTCGYCGRLVSTTITYQQLDLGGIDESYTIAKKTHHFGVECGCYAKFNRQIAHIQSKTALRTSSYKEPISTIGKTVDGILEAETDSIHS